MDWKYLFDDRILSRGQDYYEQDLVILFKNRKHGFCARVQGNEIYTVNISISDDVVTDMYCSCPHAADGNNCKHMAAVLFYAENDAIQMMRINHQSKAMTPAQIFRFKNWLRIRTAKTLRIF